MAAKLSHASVSHVASLLNLIWLTPEIGSVAVKVKVTEVEVVVDAPLFMTMVTVGLVRSSPTCSVL